MGVTYYGLRLGCFGCMLYFTFGFPLLPVAVMSWISLGVLFYLDFF